MDCLSLTLPWPPSDNRYYMVGTGKRIISKQGREFRENVRTEFIIKLPGLYNKPAAFLKTERLAVVVWCKMPDKRKRDITNLWKAIGDALQYAKVIEDDCAIVNASIINDGLCDNKMGEICVHIRKVC